MALLPAELGYRLVMSLREAAYRRGWLATHRAPAPVISIGNLTVGGTGKTPVTAWLVRWLSERGYKPAVLHGGYANDEPDLHRYWNPDAPVVVGRDRVAAAQCAVRDGARVLLLDDGFQHLRLVRDLDIVLIAAESWTERPRLLPRGPWRESPRALRRAGAVIVTRKTATPARALEVAAWVAAIARSAMIGTVALRPDAWQAVSAAGRQGAPATAPSAGPVLAVAGVAEPDLFRANVEETGVGVEACRWFGDHHQYSDRDVEIIGALAAGRPVVTTMKDAIKLRRLKPPFELWALEQRVVPERGMEPMLERLLELAAAAAGVAARPITGM